MILLAGCGQQPANTPASADAKEGSSCCPGHGEKPGSATATRESNHKSDAENIRTARAQIVNLATGVRRYEMDIGSLPSSLAQLMTSSGSPKWDGPYLESSKIPKDPWGQDYSYSNDGRGFEIKSNGPPGKNEPISSLD